jgi:hypothetical protein
VKNFIRNRDFFKIYPLIEMGADHGMWTFARYAQWLDRKTDWHLPSRKGQATSPPAAQGVGTAGPSVVQPRLEMSSGTVSTSPAAKKEERPGVIEINPEETPFGKILKS